MGCCYSPLPAERRFPADSTGFTLRAQLGDEPFAFALAALIAQFKAVPDSRKAKGLCYPLAPLLAVALLAKLARHSGLGAIASWAKLRQAELIRLLAWPHPTIPHPNTWSRAFARVDPTARDIQIGAFFAARRGCRPPGPGDLVLAIDGQDRAWHYPQWRPSGPALSRYYLLAYVFVLTQVALAKKQKELSAVPTLLLE